MSLILERIGTVKNISGAITVINLNLALYTAIFNSWQDTLEVDSFGTQSQTRERIMRLQQALIGKNMILARGCFFRVDKGLWEVLLNEILVCTNSLVSFS